MFDLQELVTWDMKMPQLILFGCHVVYIHNCIIKNINIIIYDYYTFLQYLSLPPGKVKTMILK